MRVVRGVHHFFEAGSQATSKDKRARRAGGRSSKTTKELEMKTMITLAQKATVRYVLLKGQKTRDDSGLRHGRAQR